MTSEFWQNNHGLKQRLDEVQQIILRNVHSREAMLAEAATSLANAGGKRLRPALVLLAADLGPEPSKNIINVAAAVEILHMATLVHDDIIDEARYRRGRITAHERFGKDVAVYTGDYLFTRCLLLLADCKGVEHMTQVAKAMKVICESEVYQHADRYNVDTSVRQYLRKIKGKTAALFALSAALGAKEAGAPTTTIQSIGRFGSHLGMAFQIRDDILDFTATDAELGKPTSSDMRKGNFTLPVVYALESPGHKRLRHLLRKPHLTADDWEQATAMVIEGGGIHRAGQLLERYCQKARRELERLQPSLAVDTLDWLVEQLRLNPADIYSMRPA